jgi:hypothetical protein
MMRKRALIPIEHEGKSSVDIAIKKKSTKDLDVLAPKSCINITINVLSEKYITHLETCC